MASIARLDDEPRMSIYKEVPSDAVVPKFQTRTPTVVERERLVGFPPGFVSEPGKNNMSAPSFSTVTDLTRRAVKQLFESIQTGLNTTIENKNWKEMLAEKYHDFAGDYHDFKGKHRPYRFYIHDDGVGSLTWHVKMAPPLPREGEEDDALVIVMIFPFPSKIVGVVIPIVM